VDAFDASAYNASAHASKPKPLNVTALRKAGLLKPISQGGILPLFGVFTEHDIGNCYDVKLSNRGKGFKPQLKKAFVDPFSNKSTILDTYNLRVVTPGDVLVALYPLKQTIKDVGNFMIVRRCADGCTLQRNACACARVRAAA
jgi:hypothetical protein